MTASWLSLHVPQYALSAFRDEYLRARVAQHRVRVRFPNASPGHALPQSDSVQSAPVRQGAKVGSHPSSTQAVRQAVSR